jgi:hypothetical protein
MSKIPKSERGKTLWLKQELRKSRTSMSLCAKNGEESGKTSRNKGVGAEKRRVRNSNSAVKSTLKKRGKKGEAKNADTLTS